MLFEPGFPKAAVAFCSFTVIQEKRNQRVLIGDHTQRLRIRLFDGQTSRLQHSQALLCSILVDWMLGFVGSFAVGGDATDHDVELSRERLLAVPFGFGALLPLLVVHRQPC
jgi:hypothetical protein